jgi:hypothetical protein
MASDYAVMTFLKRESPAHEWTVDKEPVHFESDLANSARAKAIGAGENRTARDPERHSYELSGS